jgi:cation diffusion facilitator CzcD-associated flavoprotein CzcO
MDIREMFFMAVTQQDSMWAQKMRDMNHSLMHRQLPNRPEMWEKLAPNYPPGCKRSVISDDYYPALNRPNVILETRPIEEITAEGIKFDGQETSEEYDLIILATGFKSLVSWTRSSRSRD